LLAVDLFGNIKEVVNIKNPTDEKDFDALGKSIAESFKKISDNQHYKVFLKSLIKESVDFLNKPDDVNDIKKFVNDFTTQKAQLERDKLKKPSSKKPMKVSLKDDPFNGMGSGRGLVDSSDYGGEDDFM